MYAPRRTEIEQLGLEHSPKLVNRYLRELRQHPNCVRHGLSSSSAQLSALAAIGELAFREPIVITPNWLIVDGHARFELAQQQRRETILCLEYELSEEEALRWLIQRHRPSHGLSAFNRALLALDLEPSLQETARANQQWGGQNKGSSSLTEAQTVDVRSKIAADAGLSPGTFDKVRKVVKSADPRNNPAATAKVLDADGWFHTGDLARCDEDGFFYIAGRSKDMIISGGVNIYPAEIEKELLDHPAIAEVSVMGTTDETWGEVPVAFVALKSSASTSGLELVEFLRPRINKIKLRRQIIFIEALPATPMVRS